MTQLVASKWVRPLRQATSTTSGSGRGEWEWCPVGQKSIIGVSVGLCPKTPPPPHLLLALEIHMWLLGISSPGAIPEKSTATTLGTVFPFISIEPSTCAFVVFWRGWTDLLHGSIWSAQRCRRSVDIWTEASLGNSRHALETVFWQ